MPQFIAIYENGLHVDLYIATNSQLQHTDPIKVYYDPNGIFNEYTWQRDEFSLDEIAKCFEDALYYFTEANSAYERKNYPWAIRIMDSSISNAAILLRYSYDKIFTFLGLKKINEIIPHEQYMLLENAFVYLGKLEFQKANDCIMKAMDVFIETCSSEMKDKLNMKLYQWVKSNLNRTLFVER